MRGARPFAALEAAVARSIGARADEAIVVACSGGPDSAALAALAAVAAAGVGARLTLAHVNAGLRASAWRDEAVVLALAARLGARAVARTLQPGSPAEERLRDDRYAALAAVARDAGAARVLAAHHARDQAETVLLALLRGAGPEGLGGMTPSRPLAPGVALERPLLGVAPETLRAYGAALGLPVALDETNADAAYARSALRAALAELRATFPHLDEAVARHAAAARAEREGTPRAALRAAIRGEVAAAAGDARDLTFERLDAAASALERHVADRAATGDARATGPVTAVPPAGAGAPKRHFLRPGVELVIG